MGYIFLIFVFWIVVFMCGYKLTGLYFNNKEHKNRELELKAAQASRENEKKYLLKFIHSERKKDMKNYPKDYPTAESWNERNLQEITDMFIEDPEYFIAEMEELESKEEYYKFVEENDSTVLKDKVKELEKELDLLFVNEDEIVEENKYEPEEDLKYFN